MSEENQLPQKVHCAGEGDAPLCHRWRAGTNPKTIERAAFKRFAKSDQRVDACVACRRALANELR